MQFIMEPEGPVKSTCKSPESSFNRWILRFHRGVQWWCKALQVLQKYFWASQFAWMLCEGIYLHTLVSQAFIDYRSLASYYAFGWGQFYL